MVKKLLNKFKSGSKYFTAVFFVVVLIILSGLITPIIINYQKNHWETDVVDKTAEIENSIRDIFKQKETKLLTTRDWLKRRLRKTLKSESYHYKKLIELVNNPGRSKYSLEVVAPNGKLIAWNETIAVSQGDIFPLTYPIGETYFQTNGLLTYLTIMDTVIVQNDVFYLIVSELIDKTYHIQNEYYVEESFSDEISRKFLTSCTIDYNPFTKPPKDGRIYTTNLIRKLKSAR